MQDAAAPTLKTGTSDYPVLRISKKALRNNLTLIRDLCPPKTKILIPVKANAYGCGISAMLPFFQENSIDFLGVANPREGSELRDLGWEGEILNLGGFFRNSVDLFFEHNIIPSITDLWQIKALNDAATRFDRILDVHIKMDYGMGRVGIKAESIGELVCLFEDTDHLKVSGIFTHFPDADVEKGGSTPGILNKFHSGVQKLLNGLGVRREDVILHSANSYGILYHPETHLDMVRPGLIFYGYFQTYEDYKALASRYSVTPSLELTAKPISLRSLQKGETISYGSTYSVEKSNYPVGVIPLGYADGIPRSLSNKIEFQGKPLLGNVTMDQIVLGGLDKDGENVRLLGEGSPPLEYWAHLSNTISYEILIGLGQRLQRIME